MICQGVNTSFPFIAARWGSEGLNLIYGPSQQLVPIPQNYQNYFTGVSRTINPFPSCSDIIESYVFYTNALLDYAPVKWCTILLYFCVLCLKRECNV